MTPEVAIRHVDEAINKAVRHQSWINESILYITGFSTGVMRRMMSNICHLPKADPAYLEVGLYAGATFCAAFNNNPTLTAVGIEDFSQPFGKDGIREELEENVKRHSGGVRHVEIVNSDCFSYEARAVLNPFQFDVYYYDGAHHYEAQAQALPQFFDVLASPFIFAVDDAHWSSVREGTKAGFESLGDKVKIERKWTLDGEKAQDDPVFWNGMEIYVISKT